MRKTLLGLLALMGGTEAASAQQAPGYAYPTYYQGQGYPQQAMPMYPQQQAAARVYYANGANGYYPVTAQPTQYYNNNYPTNSYYSNGYYGPAPQNYYPQMATPTYIYTPASQQYNQRYGTAPAARSSGANWPMPVSRTAPTQAAGPIDDPDAIDDAGPVSGQKPVIPFHRPTKDLFWIDAGYTAAFFRPMQLSTVLATTGSQNDGSPGAFGQPSTAVLYGGQPINFNLFSGMRLQAGLWLDTDNRFSIDLNGFWFFPNTENFSIAGDGAGNPVIARPIFNAAASQPGAFLNSLPGILNGALHISTNSQIFGTDFNARAHGYFGERIHVDGLFGFRYLRLSEHMNINENINPLVNNFASFQGVTIPTTDSLRDFDGFQTTNQFFGAQIGGSASYEYQWFTFEGFFKLALGGTIEQTKIDGSTTLVTPGGNVTAPGGILAVPSNIGNYSRTVFGIIPEFGFNLGVDLCQNVRLKLGYSILLWNHVVRPGNQIDPSVNPGQVPGSPAGTFANVSGPMSPSYRFNDELFWGHNFNLGVEVHY